MAVWMTRKRATELALEVEIDSAGTLGIKGAPANSHAVAVCIEAGIGVDDHQSKGLTPELVDWADDIVVMELAHAVHVRSSFIVPEDKVLHLGSLAGMGDIDDPIGSWFKGPFRSTRRRLDVCIEAYLGHVHRRLRRS